ncbi:MAG: hypothetical protein ACK40G_09260 [Cytophagaceae bacterium]
MRNSLIVFLLLNPLLLLANMANPIVQGTISGRPFVNKYVDIIHEDLYIKLDKDFKFVEFNVKYHINSSEEGISIPFIFYAFSFLDSFSVKIDGKEISSPVYSKFKEAGNGKFRDFAYYFEMANTRTLTVNVSETISYNINLTEKDMIYFEADISKGNHVIEVAYRSYWWEDRWGPVKKYGIKYILAPARYWKSFGTLNVTVNASSGKQNLKTNIGAPHLGRIDSIATWNFNEMPVDVLEINTIPEVNSTARLLLRIGGRNIIYFAGVILFIIHLVLVYLYRKRYKAIKHSIAVIVGSILAPLIFVLLPVSYEYLLDYFIGEHASGNHGYNILMIFLYPIILPLYWIIIRLIDKRFKEVTI